MDVKDLLLDRFVDSDALRNQLSALTRNTDGDGSSSAIRMEVLGILKEASVNGRTLAEKMLLEDGHGTACARRISHLQDELIRVIYDFAITHVYRNSNTSASEQIAITAIGGYGRGTLAPGSDIDLMFLLPYKQTAWGEQVIEYILYMLWDMGFKVGQATRTIEECLRLSKEDMTIRTSVLEVRFIHGTKALYKDLAKRFSKEIVHGTASEFIAAKLAERDARHKRAGESRYRVEPNIKDGKGGLRDLHTLFWIGKYFYNMGRSRDLVGAGMFTPKEYKRFRRAEKFLWTVRCNLHFMTGKTEERLLFDFQQEMAARLNYSSHGALSSVERFMKHYFLVAKEVGNLTLIACAKLEEKEAKAVHGINRLLRSIVRRKHKIRGSRDFVNDRGRLNVTNREVFAADPVNLLRFFKLSDQTGLDHHPEALELLTQSLSLVRPELRRNPEANRLFMDMLISRNGSERLLRRMNETGFLGKFMPLFGKIVAMMQFSSYHHYTVDEHLIRTIGALADIESGKLADEHPLSTELLPLIKDRQVLYLATLLHDIAKGRKEDHSIAGARLAKQLCPRLGMNEEQTNIISWLIREHLTMSVIAQSRDLSDRKTIQDFAEVVQTVERMRYLVVLTVCDIRAVGPGVWNGWKGQLLRNLYQETELYLNGGFSKSPQRARVGQLRASLGEVLDHWSEEEKKRILALPYSAYFLSTDFDAQIHHMNFLRETDKAGLKLATLVQTWQFEDITEITIIAPDHARLLSKISGACVAAGGNIVDAKIHTTSDGRALDSIFINRTCEDDESEIRRATRIAKSIEDVLTGAVKISDLASQNRQYKRRPQAFSVTPKASVNNDLSDTFSVVEIECLDRPGILSTITNTLADLNLDIGSAHVMTFGEKGQDSFYVRDLVGHKILDENRIKKIETTLLKVMQVEGGPKKPNKNSKPLVEAGAR